MGAKSVSPVESYCVFFCCCKTLVKRGGREVKEKKVPKNKGFSPEVGLFQKLLDALLSKMCRCC